MRLQGDNEDKKNSRTIPFITAGASLLILLILGAALLAGGDRPQTTKTIKQTPEQEAAAVGNEDVNLQDTEKTAADQTALETTAQNPQAGSSGEETGSPDANMKEIERLYKENKLKASDLDFWEIYPKKEPDFVKIEDVDGKPKSEEELAAEGEKTAEEEALADKDPSKDGRHTLLTYADGTTEWVVINSYIEKNNYDFTKLSMKADKMGYYEDEKKTSFIGVDISKYNGDVDFGALKESGIEFVMLRLGSRGYGSGQIMLDEKFTDYMTKAVEAGLDIGVYFFSQAITKAEAVEEANFVVQNLATYKITYPIAFDMEYISNDTARIEALSKEEKTVVAGAFLDTIRTAGYQPLLYGTKEWLIGQIDLTKLTEYDVWLSQQKDVPDYPYQFRMWQYSVKGKVAGISGDVDLNISFTDYSEK